MNARKLSLCLLAATALHGCSDIADDERLIFVEHKEIDAGAIAAFKATVLVEDFTGQKCTWCPQGTLVLEEQIALYGKERIIPVAIHSGPLGFKGTAKAVGLMTQLGVYYWNSNGFTSTTSQPTAVFNRHFTSDERDAWSTYIYNELSRTAKAGLTITNGYDSETRTLSVSAEWSALAEGDAHLQLWLTESNVKAMQIDNGVTIQDYTHNHILRDAINGEDGVEVTLSQTTASQKFTYTLDEKYVAENCDVVAFLYDDSGVIQATVAPVIKDIE